MQSIILGLWGFLCVRDAGRRGNKITALLMKICAQRKGGWGEEKTGETSLCLPSFSSHSPLRFALASARKTENEAPVEEEEEEEEAGLRKCMEIGLENRTSCPIVLSPVHCTNL